ncbi:hypothetical protein B0H13DRAFT_1885365 [Mycena leptocephala]|nr:hypothetical protein B0H13DRAFT_1885365 [Mycena leptocephala]
MISSTRKASETLELSRTNLLSSKEEMFLQEETFHSWNSLLMDDFYQDYNTKAEMHADRLLECIKGPCKELQALFDAVLRHEEGRRLVAEGVAGNTSALDLLHMLLKTDKELVALKKAYFLRVKAYLMSQTAIRYLVTKNNTRGKIKPPLYLPHDIEIEGIRYRYGYQRPPKFTAGPTEEEEEDDGELEPLEDRMIFDLAIICRIVWSQADIILADSEVLGDQTLNSCS